MRRVERVLRFIWNRLSDIDTTSAILGRSPTVGVAMIAWVAGAPTWLLITIIAAMSLGLPIAGAFLKKRTQQDWVDQTIGARKLTDDVLLRWLNDIERRQMGEIKVYQRMQERHLSSVDRHLEAW